MNAGGMDEVEESVGGGAEAAAGGGSLNRAFYGQMIKIGKIHL